MSHVIRRLVFVVTLLACVAVSSNIARTQSLPRTARITSPVKCFGFQVGADRRWRAGTSSWWMDQPVKGPDGMRAANGKLLLAENGSGKISAVTINGDKASVTVIKEGLNTPTAVEPAADTIWIAERGTGKAVSIPMPR